jgi:FkbM family methyltransferase
MFAFWKVFYRIYRWLRKPILSAVQCTKSLDLQKFFVKADHWIRIRSDVRGIIANRNGIVFSLDLSQLIDNQVFFEASYEPKTFRAFQKLVKPGMQVIDIGANVGVHTLNLAKLVGTQGGVYAIEPTDWAYRKLQANLKLNPGISRVVKTRQIVLSDRSAGVQKFEFRAQWRKAGGYIEDEVGVAEFLSLDDFQKIEQLKQVDFIKLDVDGFETKILRGALGVLNTFQPILLVEVSDFFQQRAGNSAEELIGILRGLGYDFYHEDLTKIDGILENVIAKLKDWETINIVCIPSERKIGN